MRKGYKKKRKTFTYDGKRYEVYGDTDRELIRKMTEKIEALKRGEVLVCSSMTVKDWSHKCVETYKTNLSPKSYKNYCYHLDHYILDNIGNMKIKDVKPIHCRACLNQLNGLSQYTIGYVYQIMNFIFDKAVGDELINKNPAKNIDKPKGKPYQHRRALTTYEESIFLEAIREHNHGLVFALMYGCGCRPSEAMNVCGRDITEEKGIPLLHIRGTKTKNSDRYVPIPPIVTELLPEDMQPFLPICRTYQGNKLNDRSLKRAWKSLKRIMNIKMGCKLYRNELIPPLPFSDEITPYCLRHTYCTNLCKGGVDIRKAQKLMGHANIEMTADIYTHVGKDQLIDDYDLICNSVERVRNLA